MAKSDVAYVEKKSGKGQLPGATYKNFVKMKLSKMELIKSRKSLQGPLPTDDS